MGNNGDNCHSSGYMPVGESLKSKVAHTGEKKFHIRPEIESLKVPISWDDFWNQSANSLERDYMIERLDDEALCKFVEYCIKQTGVRKPFNTYNESVIGLLAPELVKRLRGKS